MDLESLTGEIDAVTADVLGERITYRVNNGSPLYPKAHVYYRDAQEDIGAGQIIAQDIVVHIRKVDLPNNHMPNSADRITLGKRLGVTFKPTNPSHDDSGTHWIVNLKIVE
jgi:hypothetical protein